MKLFERTSWSKTKAENDVFFTTEVLLHDDECEVITRVCGMETEGLVIKKPVSFFRELENHLSVNFEDMGLDDSFHIWKENCVSSAIVWKNGGFSIEDAIWDFNEDRTAVVLDEAATYSRYLAKIKPYIKRYYSDSES